MGLDNRPSIRSSLRRIPWIWLTILLAATAARAQLVTVASVPDADQPPSNLLAMPCVDDFCTPTAAANVVQYWDTVASHANAGGVAAGLSTTALAEYLSWFMATNSQRDPICMPSGLDMWGRTNARTGATAGTRATDTGSGIFEYVRWDDGLYPFLGTLPQPPLPVSKEGYSWKADTRLASSYASNAALLTAYRDEIDAGRPNVVSFRHWHLSFLCSDAGIEYYDWLGLVSGTGDPAFMPVYSEGGTPPSEEWNGDNLGHTVTGVGYNLGFQPFCTAMPRDWIIVHDNIPNTGTSVAVPFLHDIPGNQTWMTALTPVEVETGIEPDVAVDATCDHHVVWWDGDDQIYYAQNALAGSLSGVAIKTGKQPSIAIDPNNGDIVIAFSNLNAFLAPNIYVTTSSDGGNSWSADVLVSTNPFCGNCRKPSVAIDSGSHVHVVWEDDCDLIDIVCGTDFEIISNDKPSGGSWGSPQQVTYDGMAPFLDDEDADLATDGSDLFLVYDRDHSAIRYIEGSVSGGSTTWNGASHQTVNVTSGQAVRVPAIGVDSNSDAYVVWSDQRTGTWQTVHQARNLSSWLGADLGVSTATSSATQPDLASRTDGSGTYAYVAWEEELPAGNYEIQFTALHNDGAGTTTSYGTVNLSNSAPPSRTPALAYDPAVPEVDIAWAEDPVTLPEPGAAAMGGAGALLLGLLHRVRQRRVRPARLF